MYLRRSTLHPKGVGRLLATVILSGGLSLAAAQLPAVDNASGDCPESFSRKHHHWNPLDKMSDAALKLSSIGIREPVPVCTSQKVGLASTHASIQPARRVARDSRKQQAGGLAAPLSAAEQLPLSINR